MDFLSAIGSAIVEPIVGHTVQPVARQVGYVIHFKSNLQKLEARVEELRAAREGKNIEVAETQRKGEGIHPDVQLWLKKVEEITANTDQFLKDECSQENLKCLHGFCPNLTMRHRLSRNSTKLLQEVVELHEKRRQLPKVSCGVLREEACIISTGDYLAFQSRMSTVKEIMDELKNPKTIRIGVYGIGGVGKTTLVKEAYRQAKQDQTKLFDDVVLVLDVKKNPDPEDLQKKIVEKLDMKISQSDDETIDGRAKRLCGRIKDKNVLVILDDVWEPIDLESIGLPSVATCKIMLTSRSRKALSDMGTHKDFQLHILGEEETWVLFENKAGDVVKDPSIQTVAKQVAQKCGGLPVLVVTVASALKNRTTLPPWKDALTCLQEGSDRDVELTEKAYLGLEWSYNQLTDKQLKPLFLLCGYAGQWNDIFLDDLLYYAVGLGFFEKPYTVETARNALYSWVEKLKDFCLLVDSDDDGYVTMHDLVRNAANRIASRDPQILALVKDEDEGGLKEWPDKSFLEKCTIISLHCDRYFPMLPQVMQCPALRMFGLMGNSKPLAPLAPLAISPGLFEGMKQLNVLSWINMNIGALPQSLRFLENLQTLCLIGCTLEDISLVGQLRNLEILSFEGSDVQHLPQEIGQLAHLRLLDLSNCYRLEVISPGVISSLTRLEYLTMRESFNNWVTEGERSNASLSELEHLSHLNTLEIHVPDADLLPANLFSLKLERFQIMIGETWAWDEHEHAREDEDEDEDEDGDEDGDEDDDDDDDDEEEEEEEEEEDQEDYKHSLNRLKLQLTKSIELNQGLRKLLKICHDLSLYGTESVNHIVHQFDNEEFQQLKHLCLRNNVDFIITKKVMLPNLKTLVIHECDDIRFLFTFSVARSLVQLKCLKISSCKLLEEIVSSTRECDEESMGKMFPNLEVLNLKGLEKLARFCMGSYVEFPSLKELDVDDCPELGAFICDNVDTSTSSRGIIIDKETHERDSKQEKNLDVSSETVVQSFLFDEKVGFPCLENLKINGVLKLKTIWHSQQAQDSFWTLNNVKVSKCDALINVISPAVMERLNALKSIDIKNCRSLEVVFELGGSNAHFQNLVSVSVWRCNRLKNIFPASVARSLQQLSWLSLGFCHGVEEIVGEEEGVLETPSSPQFVFPKVTFMEFETLSNLRSFYPRMHTSEWPLLQTLTVCNCKGVKTLAAQLSFLREKYEQDPLMSPQSLFLADKDSFINLEHLELGAMEIWNGPTPAELVFGKLKSFTFRGCTPAFSKEISVLFLQKLQNLEKLQVELDSSEEIFVDEGTTNNSGEIGAAGSRTLPRVRVLKVTEMKNLMHLGRENSQSDPLFPNLQILEVSMCRNLKSLQSSATSFRNLTSLTVMKCGRLNCLVTFSVAQSLTQLKKLKVKKCKRMVVIVASNVGDDDETENEIAFNRLQDLEVSDLPSLQGFCSSRNCAVFPSLVTLRIKQVPGLIRQFSESRLGSMAVAELHRHINACMQHWPH